MADLIDKLEKLNGSGSLTSDEKDQLLALLKAQASGKTVSGMTAAEQQAMIKSLDPYMKSPAMQEAFRDIARSKNADRFVQRYKPFFNAMLQGSDIVTSLGQISTANKQLSKLQQPVFGTNSVIDPALSNEIYKAQQGTFDQSRAVAPYLQGVESGYNNDVNTAKAVSGGNASAYQSYVQQANNNRTRGYAQVPAMQEQVKNANRQYLVQGIGTRQQGAAVDSQNQLRAQQLQADQYNINASNAALLGSTGRTNLRNTMSTFGDNLAAVAGSLAPMQEQFQPQANAPDMATYLSNGRYASFYDQARKSLADTVGRIRGLTDSSLNSWKTGAQRTLGQPSYIDNGY